MQRSQRTGRAHLRDQPAERSVPSVSNVPSALDNKPNLGSCGRDCGGGVGDRLARRRHQPGMEPAGDCQRSKPRPAGRIAVSRSMLARARRDHLSGRVQVRHRTTGLGDCRLHLVGVTAEDRDHPAGRRGRGIGHRGATGGDESHRGGRRSAHRPARSRRTPRRCARRRRSDAGRSGSRAAVARLAATMSG